MGKKKKYLCKCGEKFDKPEVKKERSETYFTCPICGIMIGLPGENWK